MEFIEQYKPWIGEEESREVNNYLRGGGYLTEFRKTKEFADALRDFTGAKYCSIVANGTVSLTAACLALGIDKREDEVIVPDYTMIASANAVVMAGSTPVFADVEPGTMCLSLESLMRQVTARTRAIMLVSINGRYPDQLHEILDFCSHRKIAVIEDAAQSLGSFHQGRHVGLYGDIGSFSFSMPKIITTGQGGALVTNREDVYRRIELIKNFGRESAGIDKHIAYGVNFKFTDLQAVIGLEQLKKIQERIQRKKANYSRLREGLKGNPVAFFATSEDVVPWFNDILVEDPIGLQNHLKQLKIGSRPFYPTIHTQAPYHQAGEFPHATYLSTHGLWLPSYPQLSISDMDRIVEGVASYYR